MLKKIKIFLLVFLLSFSFGFSYSKAVDININLWSSNSSWDLKSKMTSNLEEKSVVSSGDKTISWALKWARNLVLWLVMIITVWALVYTGIKLATSRWNPDEFKKTWMHLIYIIIWIFIIFASWWIVNLITKINIF